MMGVLFRAFCFVVIMMMVMVDGTRVNRESHYTSRILSDPLEMEVIVRQLKLSQLPLERGRLCA
jgi:hypothetical protein